MTPAFQIADFDASPGAYVMLAALIMRSGGGPLSQRQLQEEDARHRAQHLTLHRVLAQRDARTLSSVGVAALHQYPSDANPQRYVLSVRVLPDLRRLGLGTAMLAALTPRVPPNSTLQCSVRSDDAAATGFLEKQGFRVTLRALAQRLDLSTAPHPHAQQHIARVEAAGIHLLNRAALADDPARDAKLYMLETTLARELPPEAQERTPPFDAWRARYDRLRGHLPDSAWWVAVDAAGTYLGMTQLWRDGSPPQQARRTGLTGVLASHRGQGIATALKWHALTQAQAEGVRVVRTFNAAQNAAMRRVNQRLGFCVDYEEVTYSLNTAPVPQALSEEAQRA